MKKDNIAILLEQLDKSVPLDVDKDYFTKILLLPKEIFDVTFGKEVPENRQLIEETNRYSYLSIEYILNNQNAEVFHIYGIEKWFYNLKFNLDKDSDIFFNELRARKDLLKIMSNSKYSYSLLAQFKTYNFDVDPMKIKTEPILVIPGIAEENQKQINEWKEENILYLKTGFMAIEKRINQEEYSKAL